MAEREEGGDGVASDLGFGDRNLVLWDLESCPMPKDMEEADILPRITARLSEWGYSGPIQMLAVGDPRSFPKHKLADTGILIRHISGGKRKWSDIKKRNCSDRGVACVMSPWARSILAPANVLSIARDRCFSIIVDKLREKNYNVLQPQRECMWCPRTENHGCYSWSWSEFFDGGRPQGNLQRSRDNDGSSLLGEPMEGCSGPGVAVSSHVNPPCKFAPS